MIPALPSKQNRAAGAANGLGQEVLSRQLPVTATGVEARFDVSSLPGGVYLLRLKAGAAGVITKRVVVD